jgi:ParB/Sulfiredoxin domain
MKHSNLTTQAPSALARSDPGLARRGGDVDELRSALLRDIVVEQCSLANLKTNPRNARTHSKRQIKAIAASIEQFGFTTPLLIDDDGMILAGHGRLQAAKLLGLDRVPTIRISGLGEAEKRAFVLAENRLAQRRSADPPLSIKSLFESACDRILGPGAQGDCDGNAATSASSPTSGPPSPTSGPPSLRQWRLIWEIDDNYNVVGTIETFF